MNRLKLTDLLKIGKAKIRDARSKYERPDYFESYARTILCLKNFHPSSREFAESIDDLWLLTRQDVNYTKGAISIIRKLFDSYEQENFTDSKKEDLREIGRNFIHCKKETLEVREKLSESVRIAREKYYSWRRGEGLFKEFLESLEKGYSFSKEGITRLSNKSNQSPSELGVAS